jgi:DNA-directed RNA polymerase subunit E'
MQAKKMFYKITIKDHIRVAPRLFNLSVEEAVLKSAQQKYTGLIDPALGVIIDLTEIKETGEGIIIPGDGASYYEATIEMLTFMPELQEIIIGKIRDIADFGAFITMGPLDGMIHVSQTMDDFVSFSKEKVLSGKESKRNLKIGDKCKARIIAVSFKDLHNPKIGLTMRQPGLGKPEWAEEEKQKKPKQEDKK